MNCYNAQQLIQKSLDEPLSRGERQALDDHIADCGECRTAWDEYHRLSGRATEWVRQAAYGGDRLADRVLAAIAEEPVTQPAHAPVWRAVLVGVCSLAALAALWIYAAPAEWIPALHWGGIPSLGPVAPPTLDSLPAPAFDRFAAFLGAVFTPMLPWAGIVIAVCGAANVALFVGSQTRRRTSA